MLSDEDPLLPWLVSIKSSLDDGTSTEVRNELLLKCIENFKHVARYRNDPRFLKIWLLYLQSNKDFESIFNEMVEIEICSDHSLLYELYAIFLEAKQKWQRASTIYQIGVARKAQPLDRLKDAHSLFLQRMSYRMEANSVLQADGGDYVTSKQYVNPWSPIILKDLMKKINPDLVKYDGYLSHNKVFPGSIKNASRNKLIVIGGMKYQIKGCAGKGGFAQVFKACVNSNPDEVVALKIQKPAFPWEFYMYRQLDFRLSNTQRLSFGFGHRVHLYSDCSMLVCDYLSHGTLQDAINCYVVSGKPMDELLCIYYTSEMLYMLDSLHSVGIIHGDFKPDNMLIRHSKDDLSEDGFHDRNGPWRDQGLCLIDWGRGIDLNLFPKDINFEGDCRTSGFRCIEMQEKKPWRFQMDTYSLCVSIHMMLHNSYMEIEKRRVDNGHHVYLPKAPLKRYWNKNLWDNLFTRLLNADPGDRNGSLKELHEAFRAYVSHNANHLKKLKDLIFKQRYSLCSSSS